MRLIIAMQLKDPGVCDVICQCGFSFSMKIFSMLGLWLFESIVFVMLHTHWCTGSKLVSCIYLQPLLLHHFEVQDHSKEKCKKRSSHTPGSALSGFSLRSYS